MPGLIRAAARTAVVAGTATAVSGRVRRRQSGRWAQEDQQAYQQQAYQQQAPQQPQQSPPPTPSMPQAGSMDDKLAQLRQLGELKTQGILTEAEFEEQKRRILAG